MGWFSKHSLVSAVMGLNYFQLAHKQQKNPAGKDFAIYLDSLYPSFRQEFHIPTNEGVGAVDHPHPPRECIYFCGNSLGLQPKLTRTLVQAELDIWATRGVQGHFRHDKWPWVSIHEICTVGMAEIVGAKVEEVAIMGSLTANLHLLMAALYTPTPQKHKIIIESKAFPSDHYAAESQIRWHGFDPSTSLIQISPRQGEATLSTEHIFSVISEHADSTALLLLPGIQFYTGQAFDIARITEFAHSKGIVVGWDLAHAVGNIELRLHDWNVDFAAWCSYKYLNAGPGGIGGIFVHESIKESKSLTGWWGHKESSRFDMTNNFVPIMGAGGYQLSNPSVLDMMALRASLEVFAQTNISALRQKSIALTGYLEHLIQPLVDQGHFSIITPREPLERGAQLSLFFDEGLMEQVFARLGQKGAICDDRKPNVIRVSPTALYNTFEEIWDFVWILQEILADLRNKAPLQNV